MKKLNLFTKIFKKHLKRGKEPLHKFADDVGLLKGVFSFKGYDVNSGKLLTEGTKENLVTNESKSTIIRLLGQGESRYVPYNEEFDSNFIRPNQFRISKMRFSNDLGTAGELNDEDAKRVLGENIHEYYSIAENSHRIARVNDNLPGGANTGSNTTKITDETILENYNTTPSTILTNSSENYSSFGVANKIFDIRTRSNVQDGGYPRSPSHGSIKVTLYKTIDGEKEKIEEIFFDKTPETDNRIFYTKDSNRNKPHRIINYRVNGNFYHVSSPMSETTDFTDINNTRITEIKTANDDPNFTETKIFFDYASPYGWKFFLSEIGQNINVPSAYNNTIIASGESWDEIKLEHTTGLYNIINLIIPREGYNLGYGNTIGNRYQGKADFYSTGNVNAEDYRDAAHDYIDDYAVTFQTIMRGSQGNGRDSSSSQKINYRKAYLCTENDQIFSSMTISSDLEFKKHSGTLFAVTWRIIAPVE